jgi:hypothetical protein
MPSSSEGIRFFTQVWSDDRISELQAVHHPPLWPVSAYPTSPKLPRPRGDQVISSEWRVEWFDDDGRSEVAIFAGPNARERALRYADRQYGLFEEVQLDPYP